MGCGEVYRRKVTKSGHDQFPWPPQSGMAHSCELSPIHCKTVPLRCNCTCFQLQEDASKRSDFDQIIASEKVLGGHSIG